jgi:hypothetical protein
MSNISQQTGTQGDDIGVCLQTYEKRYTLSREGRSQAFWMHADISAGVL